MSKLSIPIPRELDSKLDEYIPWGSKGTVICELLWQLVERAQKDTGTCVYELIRQGEKRGNS